MKLIKKIIAVMLVISMVVTLQGGAFITLTNDIVKAADNADKVDFPYCIPEDAEGRDKHVKRLKEDEDENMVIYENEDGTITVYSFGSPIQYKDSNGKLVDYDPRLKEVKNNEKKNAGYAYELTSSDVSVMLPADLATNKYITIEKDKYKIDFKPITKSDNTEKVKDKDKVKDKYKAKKIKEIKEISKDEDHVGVEYLSSDSDSITYKYYVSELGVKEDIVFEEAPTTNVLQFEFKVKNVIPEIQEDGNIFFLDKDTDEMVGSMSPFYMYDSYVGNGDDENDIHGPHMSYDINIEIEPQNDNKYILTVYLDEKMLNDEDTVYPVTVDPTLILNAATDQYHDTYVYSSRNANYNSSAALRVGRYSGVYRSYIRPSFPSSYAPYVITTASMRLYNARSTGTQYINMYRVTGYWHESSLCYSTSPAYDSTVLYTRTVSATGYYWFNITSLARGWALYSLSGGADGFYNRGLLLKEKTETGTYKEFCSERYYLSYRRPYMTITYKQDNEAPDNVAWLTATTGEDPNNNGKATITASWPETTDNSSGDVEGVKEYELTLTDAAGNFYAADGTMTDAATPENYIPEIIPHVDEIIIDNMDTEFSTSGTWVTSTSSPGYYGSNYHHEAIATSNASETATWTPNIPVAGDYKIYMRWTAYSNRSDAVPVEIKYNGGTDTSVTVNQTQNNNEWVLLGTYDLSAGTGNYVKINGSDYGYTIADAVKFVFNDTYTKEFVNLPDNTTYDAKVRACDDMPIGDWTAPHWSGYTLSGAIVVGDIEEIIFTTSPIDWTNSQTPTITWSGIDDALSVEFSVDSGTWTDSGYVGLDGSGMLPSLGLATDGQYQIKIRGMDTTTSTPTPESSEVTYYYDNTAPSIVISSPSDGATIGESVDILGSVLDDASGVASWTLEYNDGSEPITWNSIATGTEAITQGQNIATWDTSALVAGNYDVRLTAVDNAGHNAVEEEIALIKPVSVTLTTPTNVSAEADVNYMMAVTWEDGINPSGTTYEVYRDSTDSFVPDDTPLTGNMVAENVTNTYWYDFDVEMSNSYYYKIIATYDVGEGMREISTATAASNEGTVTANTEVIDKLGLQDYWKFTAFSAGNGVGYINVANGNLVYNSTDSVFPGYMLAMVMRRTYNSQSDVKTTLGYGWDFSYNTRLYKEIDGEDEDIILKDGDGSLHYFQYSTTTSGIRTYTTPDGVFMDLTYNETTDEYTIQRKDYVTYVFDGNLQIKKLSELNGNYLLFNYDQAGRLSSVENCDADDTSVNQAYFTYYLSTDTGVDAAHVGLLSQITDEAGRTYKYEYEAGNAYLKKAYLDIAGTTNDYIEEYTYATGTHNLASVIDTNNHTTGITYLTGAKVSTVTYPDSKYFTLTYATGVSKTLFDSTALTLDTTTVTDSWGHSTEYAYNSAGSVRVTTNALNETTELDYNTDMQVTAVRYQNTVDVITTVAYNADGNITSITDPLGHATTFTYDTTFANKVKTVTVPIDASNNATTTNIYNTDGNLQQTTDAEGNVTEYTYYDTGLIKTVINHVGAATSALGAKTYYTYYTNGWLHEVRQGSKNDSTLALMSKVVSYDAQGNPTIVEDALGNQSKVVYDALGRPTNSYLPDRDTQESTQNWTNNEYTTAQYDLKGNATSAVDIKGITTNITYDDMDRILTTVQDPTGNSITNSIVYDTYQPEGAIGAGYPKYLMVTGTNPEGVKSIQYYDALGRVIKTAVSNDTTELTTSIVEYDRAGNVVSSKDLIESTTEYRETTFEYDILGRQTKAKMYNDASQLVSTTTTYDYVGNVVTTTDPQTYITYYYYDKIGRLTRVKAGGYNTYYNYDNIINYGGIDYLMNKITDAKGRVNETYLDEYGNPVIEIDQGDTGTSTKRIVQRTFNINGSVNTVIQADNQVDYYTYNNWGQVDLVRYNSPSSTDNQTAYTYNAHGQISTMADSKTDTIAGGVATVMTSWTYDTLGRTTSSTQDGTTVLYAYDKANNVIKLEQPTDGSTTTEVTDYNYNGYGQLDSVYHNSEKIRDYNYLTTGQLDETVDYLKFDESNTTTTMSAEYDYTALGQLSRIKYVNDTTAATMEQYTYAYDKRGNITTESLYNTHGGTTSLTKAYVYDSLSRLTKTTIGSDVTDYTYDSTGNRTSEISRQTNDWYDKYHYYNEFDQLERVTTNISNGAQDTEIYDYNARGALENAVRDAYNVYKPIYKEHLQIVDYDEFGNPVFAMVPVIPLVIIGYEIDYKVGTESETDYTYDKAGYLQKTVEVFDTSTTTTGHFYNGMEQRVRKTQGSDTTKYIYSGSALLFTTDGNNAKLTENVLAPNGQIIAGQRFDGSYDGEYYFYNQDIRNSTMAIISDTYSPVKYYSYDEYGKQTAAGSSSFINDSTYTGSVSEGGNIFYMMARFYDANNGRFLTQDSYTGNAYEPMSQNLYSYVGNNPVNYVDPTGHNGVRNYSVLMADTHGFNEDFFKRYSRYLKNKRLYESTVALYEARENVIKGLKELNDADCAEKQEIGRNIDLLSLGFALNDTGVLLVEFGINLKNHSPYVSGDTLFSFFDSWGSVVDYDAERAQLNKNISARNKMINVLKIANWEIEDDIKRIKRQYKYVERVFNRKYPGVIE